MISNIQLVIFTAAYAIYFMLPAYLANVSALAFGGGAPLDMGRSLKDGRRMLGDGVTWRGTFIGTLIGMVIGLLQGIITGNVLQGAILGLALGGGAMVGDACGSFIKRRLKIERGRPAPIMDQLDFVIGALVFASLVVPIPFDLIIFIIIISIFLHLGANIIAYLLGIKNVWY
jgi:CDP-2,3-bis-(O-geranylgeranyl)-sn-glycerol synthase